MIYEDIPEEMDEIHFDQLLNIGRFEDESEEESGDEIEWEDEEEEIERDPFDKSENDEEIEKKFDWEEWEDDEDESW